MPSRRWRLPRGSTIVQCWSRHWADLGLIQMLRRREGYRLTIDRALMLELQERRDRVDADECSVGYWWMTGWQNAITLAGAGEHDPARESLVLLRRRATDRGDEQATPYLVTWLSWIAFYQDDWGPAAAQYADEGYTASVSAPGERAFALVPRAIVAAHLGNVDAARDATDEGFRLAEQTGMVPARFEHQAVRGSLELSLGAVEAARRLLAPLPRRAARSRLRRAGTYPVPSGSHRDAGGMRRDRRGEGAPGGAGRNRRAVPALVGGCRGGAVSRSTGC